MIGYKWYFLHKSWIRNVVDFTGNHVKHVHCLQSAYYFLFILWYCAMVCIYMFLLVLFIFDTTHTKKDSFIFCHQNVVWDINIMSLLWEACHFVFPQSESDFSCYERKKNKWINTHTNTHTRNMLMYVYSGSEHTNTQHKYVYIASNIYNLESIVSKYVNRSYSHQFSFCTIWKLNRVNIEMSYHFHFLW